MTIKAWVKFENDQPMLLKRESFVEFWEDLRNFMFRNPTARLEWIIFE